MRAWTHDLDLRRWWIGEGLRIFLVVAGLSLAAAAVEVIAVAGALASAPGAAAALNAAGFAGSTVAQLVIAQWSLTFFGAHLVPVDLGLSGSGLAGLALSSLSRGLSGTPAAPGVATSLSGLGSLSLTCVVLALGFRSGRALERGAPYEGGGALAALRAAGVAVPYAAASLVLFMAGHWHVVVAGQVVLDASPAAIGLVLPPALVGLAAAAGATWARPEHTRVGAALVRGSALGLVGLALGIVATLTLGVVAALLWLAGHAGAQTASPPRPTPAPASPATPVQDSNQVNWSGLFLLLLGLVLIVLYVPNVVAGLWAGNVGFWLVGLGPLAAIMLPGAALGAIGGAVLLRPVTDFVEQAAFVAAFALGSFVLGLGSQVALLGYSVGASPGVVVLVSGMLAAVAAALGGAIGRTSGGQWLRAWRPLAACAAAIDARVARVVEPAAARPAPAGRAPVALRCAGCGREAGARDHFCAGCGARIRGGEPTAGGPGAA